MRSSSTGAAVLTYPAPATEVLSGEHEVLADGKRGDIYTARVLDPPFAGKEWDFGGPYAFANFDMAGRVTVQIRTQRSLRHTVVRPEYPDVGVRVMDKHTVSISLHAPPKILHYAMTPFLLEPGEEMRLEDVCIENVRVHGEGQRELARLKPVVNHYMQNKVPGHVPGVHFKNVEVYGRPGGYFIQLECAEAQHQVQEVTLEKVRVLGQGVAADSPQMKVGPQVEGVRYVGGAVLAAF